MSKVTAAKLPSKQIKANAIAQTTTPKRPSSFRKRVVLAMVAVAFLSALISGLLYRVQASKEIVDLVSQAQVELSDKQLERLQRSNLPERLKETIEQTLQLRLPSSRTAPAINLVLAQAIWIVIFVAIVSALIAWAVGWWLTKRIVGPLEQLGRASYHVAGGDFSQRVQVKNNDEVGQVAYSFNLMAEQLQAVENKRRELLGDVAHELKTPLASIQGHIEALRDNLPRAKANPQAIYEVVLEDVAALDRMVGSLRTWLNSQSLIEHLEAKPLKLAEELPFLLESFQPRAEAAQIKLSVQLDPKAGQVLTDRTALRHILSNLIDNALRYTPAGGAITVSAWPGGNPLPDYGQPHLVTLAVRDTGTGIAPQHWPHLFERFYRVDKSRSRDTGGTGLGLTLVKDLVTAQNGRVWLDSRVGQGTIFYVTLPA